MSYFWCPLLRDVLKRVRAVDGEAHQNDVCVRIGERTESIIVFLACNTPHNKSSMDITGIDNMGLFTRGSRVKTPLVPKMNNGHLGCSDTPHFPIFWLHQAPPPSLPPSSDEITYLLYPTERVQLVSRPPQYQPRSSQRQWAHRPRGTGPLKTLSANRFCHKLHPQQLLTSYEYLPLY